MYAADEEFPSTSWCIYGTEVSTLLVYTHLFSPLFVLRALLNFILFALIIVTVLGEEYKLRSSSLCTFLYRPAPSSLLGPNILLSALFASRSLFSIRIHLARFGEKYENFHQESR
jgi:hypothetical protein